MMKAKGSPKPVASGKKGNVGGMMTPGRHGNHKVAMMAGMKNLVAAGPGTKKTASISNMPRPEGAVLAERHQGLRAQRCDAWCTA